MRTRLADGRREELLDGVMGIIAERGFAEVRIADMARELHCSAATLYKIASSKDSLVLLAIGRWGERTLADLDRRADLCSSPSDRARCYFRAGAGSVHPMSPAFFRDVERFESTRIAWLVIVNGYLDRFIELVDLARDEGEAREVNTRFLSEMLRQIAFLTRNPDVLGPAGLTSEQAILEVDRIIWDGIRAQ